MFRKELIDILRTRSISLHELALFLDSIADTWEMTLYDSGRRAETRSSST